MPRYKSSVLREYAKEILVALGAPYAKADLVGRLLVEANQVGHDSHGLIRIPQYGATIESGEINPVAEITKELETDASVVVDANWGFGQCAMQKTVEIGLDKAASCGVSAVTLRNANHIGRLGSYVQCVAEKNMIGLLFANMHGSGVCVVPWGGTSARLGTNPLAAGLPRGDRGTIVLDMTTSAVAEGKIRVRRNRGESVPEGWIVDSEGKSSTDPEAFYGSPRGGILPFGGVAGHKGYGLSIIVELLAGALGGAGCAGSGSRNGNGVFLLVIDISRFIPFEEYCQEVDGLVKFVKSSSLAPGFDEILVPGELEEKHRKRNMSGIEIDEKTWEQIVDFGKKYSIDPP